MAQLVDQHDGPAIRATLTGSSASSAQLRGTLEREARRQGLSDLAASMEACRPEELGATLTGWLASGSETLLVGLDDLHLADADVADVVGDLIDRWPRSHRLVVAARRLPGALRGRLIGTDSTVVGVEELRFDAAEARALFALPLGDELDAAELDRVVERCGGLAAALRLTAGQVDRAQGSEHPPGAAGRRAAAALAQAPATLTGLLTQLLEAAGPQVSAAIARLTGIPAFDDRILRAVGIEGLDGLIDVGLPVEQRGGPLWAFPDVVREALPMGDTDELLVRLAVRRYVDAGQPSMALELARGREPGRELAHFLAELPADLIGRLDPWEFAAAVAALPEHLLAERPRILINLADAYVLAGHTDAYAEAVQRAARLEAADGSAAMDPAEVLEVRAADITIRAIARNDDALVADAEELLADPALPMMARGRLLGGIGRATASRRSADALRAGARRLDESARTFERAGAPVHAVASQVVAAAYASIPLGRYAVALRQLDEALTVDPSSRSLRIGILPYRAFVLVDLGRYAEAEAVLGELRRTARSDGPLGNERAAVFARWAEARMASQRRDRDATWAACQAVERAEVPVDTGNGAFFRADAVQLLARVGAFEDAQRLLDEARARDRSPTSVVTMAAFALAAYAGDHETAEASLAILDGGRAVEPRDRWRVSLLHAWACRDVDVARARRLAAAAFEEAGQLGYPDLPMIQESALARALLPLAAEASATARESVAPVDVTVRLLGRLELADEGRSWEPSGRPAQLIAYLGLHGGQATVEEVIDALWPDTDVARGRERLRTVLARVRRDHLGLVERHEELLRWRRGVRVDVDDFLALCHRASESVEGGGLAAAGALEVYLGEAVPNLGAADWLDAPRRYLEQQALTMHDIVAAEAETQGRLDDAIRTLQAAIRVEPLAEDRYVAAARLLAEQGRRARALALLAEARDVVGVAGLIPSQALERLERYLERDPVTEAHRAS